MTAGFRTLFLAKEPTWDGWLEALRNQWVAAVRHDEVSGDQTWMHTSSDEVRDFLEARASEWQWWGGAKNRRPLVSLVALRPSDTFEVGHPSEGICLRVRCAWTNTTQGRPKEPIVELRSVRIDDREVTPVLAAPRPPKGAGFLDHYYAVEMSGLSPGEHRATAVVESVRDQSTTSRSITFRLE
jgi:hypothetical protein